MAVDRAHGGRAHRRFQPDAGFRHQRRADAGRPSTIPTTSTQTGPTVWTRAPYPNAVIPNPNPAALKIMNIWPLPNRTPIDAFNTQNFFTQAIRTFSRSSNNSRMDYHTGRHSLYASGGVSIGSIETPSPFGADSQWFGPATALSGFSGGGAAGPRHVSDDNPYIQLGDTVILSPTLVLDIRGGANRIHSNYLSYPPTAFHGRRLQRARHSGQRAVRDAGFRRGARHPVAGPLLAVRRSRSTTASTSGRPTARSAAPSPRWPASGR